MPAPHLWESVTDEVYRWGEALLARARRPRSDRDCESHPSLTSLPLNSAEYWAEMDRLIPLGDEEES